MTTAIRLYRTYILSTFVPLNTIRRVFRLLCFIVAQLWSHIKCGIQTPRGTNNKQFWDTSNRAVNLVINNLKGIFFEDDNFEHMAFGVVANWGEHGKTIIRICELDKLFECAVFGVKTEKP